MSCALYYVQLCCLWLRLNQMCVVVSDLTFSSHEQKVSALDIIT